VAKTALEIIVDDKLADKAKTIGEYLMKQLNAINSSCVKEIRGKGLLIGVEIKKEAGKARMFCERLMHEGILAKETHDYVIRFAPPLIITKQDIDWALNKIKSVLV
jgi:ornithine--oxo-acid transaminase